MHDSDNINLQRWRTSGLPQQWVRQRHGKWNHQDWLSLLDDLRSSPYWPMRPDDIGRVLEDIKAGVGQAAPNSPNATLPSRDPAPSKRLKQTFLKGSRILAFCNAVIAFIARYLQGKDEGLSAKT